MKAISCITLLLAASTALAAPTVVKTTKIGTPTWQPAGAQVFTAPIGTAESAYAEFLDTMLAVLPSPQHEFNPVFGVGPGAPHDGPYDGEMAEGVAANGYETGRIFSSSAVTDGGGIWLAYMLVPGEGAATGSSPDSANGPIIANALFPMTVTSSVRHGSAIDGPFSFDVPALDGNIDPPFAVDGHSHVPIFHAEGAEFFPGRSAQGVYDFTVTLIDATGNGWLVQTRVAISR